MKQSEIKSRLTKLLDYIQTFQIEQGRSPSYREIQRNCGYKSIGLVASDVGRLKARGMIEGEADIGGIAIPVVLKDEGTINASIVGACPCGEPIEAIENIEGTVALPISIFGREKHIILRAKGRSMVNRGIYNGDLMVVRVQPSANVGEVVIARVNGEDATAKVLAKKNGKFYLQAANDELDELGNKKYKDIYPKGEWDIVGVVDNVIHAPLADVRP